MRMNRVNTIAISVIFMLCSPMLLQAKSKGLKIEGFVGQSSTVPAASETVKLLDGTGKIVDMDQTNFFGKYKFDKLVPGYYIIQVRKIKKEVLLKDKKIRMDIDLSAATGSMNYFTAGQGSATSPQSSGKPAGGFGSSGGDQGLMRQMSATYYGYSGSTETKAALCLNGAYYDTSESSYSGNSSDSLGNQTMAWGAANQGQGKGSWTAQGTVQQGVLNIRYANGDDTKVEYRAIDNAGCYTFNAVTMCRSGPANCQ